MLFSARGKDWLGDHPEGRWRFVAVLSQAPAQVVLLSAARMYGHPAGRSGRDRGLSERVVLEDVLVGREATRALQGLPGRAGREKEHPKNPLLPLGGRGEGKALGVLRIGPTNRVRLLEPWQSLLAWLGWAADRWALQ